MNSIRSVLTLGASAATVLVGCSGHVTPSTSFPTARPSVALSPQGWGAKPPTHAELEAMDAWVHGPGVGVASALKDADESSHAFTQAVKASNGPLARATCRNVTEPLTKRLPIAASPPDADLTNGLTALVDDGKALSAACSALANRPGPSQLNVLEHAGIQLATDLSATTAIMRRDRAILRSGKP